MHELKQVHRQADAEFVGVLHAIRLGARTEEERGRLRGALDTLR